jgi:hypothetical protein
VTDGKDDKIRNRAYALWQAEGQPEGRDQDHWEEARRQVEAELAERRADAAEDSDHPQTIDAEPSSPPASGRRRKATAS